MNELVKLALLLFVAPTCWADVRAFRMGNDKEAALKPLEEADYA